MVFGEYPADMNDASILNRILQSDDEINNILQDGDTMVLDRGFRDSQKVLSDRNLKVEMPAFTNTKNKNAVLTATQANASRKVTKIRFVVETRNGNMKTVWKMFDKVWRTEDLIHLMDDFRICAGLINKFFERIISDKSDGEHIAGKMLELAEKPNHLLKIVRTDSFQKVIKNFQEFSIEDFPKLSLSDLKGIGLGTYSMRLAKGYYFEHIKANQNEFKAYICQENDCKQFCHQFYTTTNEPKLILVKMNSRFTSKKSYYTYVLIDSAGTDNNSDILLAHYCDCKSGSRTVGSCAHIMAILWYMGLGQYEDLREPAAHVNKLLVAHKNR